MNALNTAIQEGIRAAADRAAADDAVRAVVMSGRFVDAGEALAMGLVDRVVPAGEVYEAALALVRPYVNGPALALRAAKLAVDRGLQLDLASGLAFESQLFAALFGTHDKAEGMAAFVEKRKPDFTGT